MLPQTPSASPLSQIHRPLLWGWSIAQTLLFEAISPVFSRLHCWSPDLYDPPIPVTVGQASIFLLPSSLHAQGSTTFSHISPWPCPRMGASPCPTLFPVPSCEIPPPAPCPLPPDLIASPHIHTHGTQTFLPCYEME